MTIDQDMSIDLATNILNSVSAHLVVVGRSGKILAVNEAWTNFSRQNGNPSAQTIGVGANYLRECRRAAERGCLDAETASDGIAAVLHGRLNLFEFEYECHSATVERWFVMRVTPLRALRCVVVAHENITTRKLAERELRSMNEQLERRVLQRTNEILASNQKLKLAAKAFDNSSEAIVITDAERNILTANLAFTQITGYEPHELRNLNPIVYLTDRHNNEFLASQQQELNQWDHWQGEIWSQRKNGEIFPAWERISVVRNEHAIISNYVIVLSDISQAKQHEEHLQYLAHHDVLTGLANRLLFAARLEQALARALRNNLLLGLICIDMDNFKYINDSLGHSVGDDYLKVIGERLKGAVRDEDTVARLGGDEFAILIVDVSEPTDLARIAEKLILTLANSVEINGHSVASTASLGMSLFPYDAETGENLLKAADTAMYHAKAEGRNNAKLFQQEMSARTYRRLALENSLRNAVARRELRLHYQPVMNLQTGECVGLEALIRWQSPEHGIILPDEFIPLAEETGLIDQIGKWVVDQGLSDLSEWRRQQFKLLRLAINVSWRQFKDSCFVEYLLAAIGNAGLFSEEHVELELTESVLQGCARAIADVQRVRASGVHVLIDDFGTGYSSLSQLMEVPVHGLKIDRQFVQQAGCNPRSLAIVRTIIALAKGLNLDLVAEGVETEEQATLLRSEGCLLAQGFFFSSALKAEDVPTFLLSLPAQT